MRNGRIVTEMEWWDGAAMAVDMLLEKPGLVRGSTVAAGKSVAWIGNVSCPPGSAAGMPAAVTAYVFDGVRDAEILRRLNQMPDETPLDMLAAPFAVYCPEMSGFVSINDPDTPLEEHLEILKKAGLGTRG